MNPRFETDALLALAEEFKTIDFDVYFRTLHALNEHDGSASLRRIAAPALVVTGARDLILPPSVARDLAGAAPARRALRRPRRNPLRSR